MSALTEKVLAGSHPSTALKDLGLRGRGVVYIANDELVQLIDRSSRVLRKDAERFCLILATASEKSGQVLRGHLLVRRAPICSKARAWLEDQGIVVRAV